MRKSFIDVSKHVNIWQLQEAKAQFSQVIKNAQQNGYQIITKQGEPVVVMLSKEEFDTLTQPKSSLLEFFMKAPYPEFELDIERQKDLPRDIDL